MADSKSRSGQRPAAANAARPSRTGAVRSARTVAAVSATPTSRPGARPAARGAGQDQPPEENLTAAELDEEQEPVRPGPPLWLQLVTFVLAILGLGISAYETWAHFNGSHLAGCSSLNGGTFNCTAVITSPQSMVFGVIPVAVLGLLFYVAAVPLFSPWAWRLPWRWLNLVRLASAIIGMGFVMYLIYAEIYQIQQVCEYCTGVHIVTFLLFVITVFSAAIWGLGGRSHELD